MVTRTSTKDWESVRSEPAWARIWQTKRHEPSEGEHKTKRSEDECILSMERQDGQNRRVRTVCDMVYL